MNYIDELKDVLNDGAVATIKLECERQTFFNGDSCRNCLYRIAKDGKYNCIFKECPEGWEAAE